MEEVRTTDQMLILREKGGCRASSKLLINVDAYDTVRVRTVLSLHQIKTVQKETKRRRMASIKNAPVKEN